MRWLRPLLLALLPSSAFAQAACPSITFGWAKQYQITASNTITAVLYDQAGLLMYVLFNNVIPSAYVQVPVGVMNAFGTTTTPLNVYNQAVVPSYNALFLQEKSNCPILQEGGAYIWTTFLGGSNIGYPLLLEGGAGVMQLQSGVPLWLNYLY